MSKLRAIIADDEGPARKYLLGLLAGFDQLEVVGKATNGREAVELINDERPDVAFLDLQMPETSGLDVVRAIDPSDLPYVVFVTAFDDRAIEAFEINAVDYLLKPVEADRLGETIERIVERSGKTSSLEAEKQKVQEAVSNFDVEFLRRIPVKKRDDIYLLDVSNIISIVADGELLQQLHSVAGLLVAHASAIDQHEVLGEKFARHQSRGDGAGGCHTRPFRCLHRRLVHRGRR